MPDSRIPFQFFILAFLSLKGYGQGITSGSFILTDTVEIQTTGTAEPIPGLPVAQWPYLELQNTLENTSGSPIRFGWKFLSADMPAGWAITGFCDNINCFAPNGTWDSGMEMTSGEVAVGENSPLWLHVSAPGTSPEGKGVIRFAIRTEDNLDTTTFILNKSSATGIGLVPQQDPIFNLYPNPVTSMLTIQFRHRVVAGVIRLYDINGVLKRQIPLVKYSQVFNIPVDLLPNGAYFVSVADSQNNVIGSCKFVKK